ncbi:DgyrCDS14486 [Dimorphilus gyrociliatus]|uniref:DgyrCDS14486 n=1 Tax=Dimorphilus gyrociliatus TaxID=2664684 RepID=A0A7I8WDT3_9ANNE|nr:DgyrCDS14486 [Dimorphilus gyrociliatus]
MVNSKAKNNQEDGIKFPQMKNIHIRCMEKGEEDQVAKILVHGFSNELLYDENSTKNIIVTVDKNNKQIAGICKVQDSNSLGKKLSLFEILKTIPIRTAFWIIMTFSSFDKVCDLILEDEQVVESLTIHDNYKKQGIGKNLLRHAECMAKQRKSKKISLFVYEENPIAIKLYKNEGYVITHTIYDLKSLTFGNETSLKMEKTI